MYLVAIASKSRSKSNDGVAMHSVIMSITLEIIFCIEMSQVFIPECTTGRSNNIVKFLTNL